jgi:hypothetical protein
VLEEKYADMGRASPQTKRENSESVITYQNDAKSAE